MVSGLLLFVVAFVRFNRPPTNRTGTTFFLFYTGMFFYYALSVGLWLFVIVLLGTGGYGLGKLGLIESKIGDTLTPTLPIIGLLFVAIASQIPRVRIIDSAARQICIQLTALSPTAVAFTAISPRAATLWSAFIATSYLQIAGRHKIQEPQHAFAD
jgi:hypothetical protein